MNGTILIVGGQFERYPVDVVMQIVRQTSGKQSIKLLAGGYITLGTEPSRDQHQAYENSAVFELPRWSWSRCLFQFLAYFPGRQVVTNALMLTIAIMLPYCASSFLAIPSSRSLTHLPEAQ